MCWCKFRRRVPEGSGEFWCKMVYSGRFRRVALYDGVGSGGRFRKVPKGWFRKILEGFLRVPESSGACWYGIGGKDSDGSGDFR